MNKKFHFGSFKVASAFYLAKRINQRFNFECEVKSVPNYREYREVITKNPIPEKMHLILVWFIDGFRDGLDVAHNIRQ